MDDKLKHKPKAWLAARALRYYRDGRMGLGTALEWGEFVGLPLSYWQDLLLSKKAARDERVAEYNQRRRERRKQERAEKNGGANSQTAKQRR
jgi:hypothetical protein